MLKLLRRIPKPVIVVVAVAWLGLAIFVRAQGENDRDLPVIIWLVYGIGSAVLVAILLLGIARGLFAADRGEFDPINRLWIVFFIITGGLLAIPIVWLLDNESTGDVLAGAIMFAVGLVMAALFVLYMRKPVRRHGTRVDAFQSEKGRRWATATARYGGAWRLSPDPDALYAVSWMERPTRSARCATRGCPLGSLCRTSLAGRRWWKARGRSKCSGGRRTERCWTGRSRAGRSTCPTLTV